MKKHHAASALLLSCERDPSTIRQPADVKRFSDVEEIPDDKLIHMFDGVQDLVRVDERFMAQGIKPLQLPKDELRAAYAAELAKRGR